MTMRFGLSKRRVLWGTLTIVGAAVVYAVRMWQSYYRKQKLRLFGELVTMLHGQYRYLYEVPREKMLEAELLHDSYRSLARAMQ